MSWTQSWARFTRTKSASIELLRMTGMYTEPPIDVDHLAIRLDIDVYRYDKWPDEISGQIDYNGKSRPTIWVNSNNSSLRQRFMVAHGIAHAILHMEPEVRAVLPRETNFSGSTIESEANGFAVGLLIPFEFLEWATNRYNANNDELAAIFAVSKSLMELRMKQNAQR